MKEEELEYHTPLPGVRISGDEVQRLRKAFLEKFRVFGPGQVPNNVPTACLLKGVENPGYLNSTRFREREAVFLFLDDADCLHRTTPQEFLHYLSAREPWEDYDLCLFDEALNWCVAVSHNDRVCVIDEPASPRQNP